MPNLYQLSDVKEPIKLVVDITPTDKVTVWYHAQEISPALDSFRDISANYEAFEHQLADWDLTVPSNILRHMEKFEETTNKIQEKVALARKPTTSQKESRSLLSEIEELRNSVEKAPAPDFSEEEKLPIRKGIVLQLNHRLLNALSVAIAKDMFPNLKRDEEFETSFSAS
jgi:hypothetical protein